MANLPEIECALPWKESFLCMSNDRFLVSPELILTCCAPFSDLGALTLQRDVRYLIACNRITRHWADPLRFPAPFDHRDMEVKLAGMLDARTFATLCTTLFGQKQSCIQLFVIGQALDALTVTRRFYLDWSSATTQCTAFIPMSGHFHMMLSTSLIWNSQPQQHIIYEISRDDSVAIVERDADALDGLACTYAFQYNDELYVLCGDDYREQTMYVLRNIYQLERVTGYEEFASTFRIYGQPTDIKSSCGSRFMVSFQYQSWQVKAAVYDIETNKWTARFLDFGPGRIHFGHLNARCVSQGEHLVAAYIAQRQVLCALWMLPPKLSAIALRVIHRNLPAATAERLKDKAEFVDVKELAEFLNAGGSNTADGTDSS